ncbi:MAG: hypothetical protein HQK89_04600 [Nitrospirae bacterium]|nr:hypothetical protein [Nitrospirota bacterium]
MIPHPYYVVDTSSSIEKKKVYFWIIIVALILSDIIIKPATSFFNKYPYAPQMIEIFSTIAIYQLILILLENYLWKTWVGWLFSINIPNLSGKWEGNVCLRSRNGVKVENNFGTLTISQSWSTLSITFDTNRSRSFSTCAFIGVSDRFYIIEYEYMAEKSHIESEDFQEHHGFAKLEIYAKPTIKPDKIRYYTDNGETGTVTFQ